MSWGQEMLQMRDSSFLAGTQLAVSPLLPWVPGEGDPVVVVSLVTSRDVHSHNPAMS